MDTGIYQSIIDVGFQEDSNDTSLHLLHHHRHYYFHRHHYHHEAFVVHLLHYTMN